MSHPHTLTCKSITAAGGQSISHCFQLLEGSPAPELEELPMCTHIPPGLCLVAGIYPWCPWALTPQEQGLAPVQRWHKGNALAMPQHESLVRPGQTSGGPGMPTSISERC